MQRENETKYILIYFGAIFCFALGGAFVRYSVLLPCSTGFYRMLLTVLILLPVVWRELRHTNRRDVRNLLLGGLLFGLNIWLWNYSLVATTQANANLLANLHVFVTAPVSCLVYHEKLRGHFFLVLLCWAWSCSSWVKRIRSQDILSAMRRRLLPHLFMAGI